MLPKTDSCGAGGAVRNGGTAAPRHRSTAHVGGVGHPPARERPPRSKGGAAARARGCLAQKLRGGDELGATCQGREGVSVQ